VNVGFVTKCGMLYIVFTPVSNDPAYKEILRNNSAVFRKMSMQNMFNFLHDYNVTPLPIPIFQMN